jgi:hypothetical protein
MLDPTLAKLNDLGSFLPYGSLVQRAIDQGVL